MKNLSILFVAPVPPPVTGQSVACELLFNSLSLSHEVYLVDINKKSFKQGINSISRLAEVLYVFAKVSRNIKRSQLIYFTVSESVAGMFKDFVILLLCYRYLGRMVIHLHGGAGMRLLMSEKHPLLRAINSFFLKRVGAVVVLGERLKSIFSNAMPLDRLYAVPNFANDEFFVSPDVIESKFASTQPLRLLFLSNLLPGKGHLELLAALSQLPLEQRVCLQVDFAGGFESAEDESNFRQRVLAVEGLQVQVHGVVRGEHKRQLLKRAHLFCLPTYYPYEGQPISILEAYASGCAVMTTNHSGIFDTFTPGINGLELLPRKPESIKEALSYALVHPQALHKFAKANRLDAEEKYRASIHLDALQKIIFSVEKQAL